MIAAAVIKLSAAALVPSSFELQEVILMTVGREGGSGPWVALENEMVLLWMWLTSSVNLPIDWSRAVPFVKPNGEISLLLALTRLPAFLTDVATTVVLYLVVVRSSSSAERARLAALVWFLNPYTIFAIELLAVPDILAAFMTLLATVLVLYKKPVLSALPLAVGIAVKFYPVLLVPVFLIVCLPKVRRKRLFAMAYAVFMSLGLIGYFNWASSGLPISALINYSPTVQPMDSIFNTFPGTRISLVTVVLVVTYVATYLSVRRSQLNPAIAVLATILMYFAFSDPYPQYLLWSLPFLVFDLTYSKRHGVLLTALVGLQLADWFFMSDGFLTPSGYSMLLFALKGQNLAPYSLSIGMFLNQFGDFAVDIASTLLYAISLIYVVDVIRYWFSSINSVDYAAQSATSTLS
jgi:hypothetical protein